MHDVKRKPNSPGHWGTVATARALANPNDNSPKDFSAVRGNQTTKSTDVRPSLPVTRGFPATATVKNCHTRIPVITGEAHYKGTLNVEGVIAGQLGGNGGSLGVRQKSSAMPHGAPELSGAISFQDLVRVNGHIAGTVHSEMGTLLVDVSAIVNADVDVAVALINGTVMGDIVAHQRVELGSSAKIYGNIWTRSIEIKPGAIFEGICTMLTEERITG